MPNLEVHKPRCDCFAFKNYECTVLRELVCRNRKCSFYKTQDEHNKSIKKANKRLAQIGLVTKKQKNSCVSSN